MEANPQSLAHADLPATISAEILAILSEKL
jgi:hypothetical protein